MLFKRYAQRLGRFAFLFAFLGLVAWTLSPVYVADARAELASSALDFPVGAEPKSVVSADFNNDGKTDLATANRSAGTLSILLGQGNGNFSAAANVAVGGETFSLAVGDFNNDAKSDLVVAKISNGSVSLLLGDGAGGFGTPSNFSFGENPASIAVGDFNGDGKADIAVADAGFNQGGVYVLLGTGTGSFGAATKFTAGLRPRAVATGDFNSDGKIDLAVANVGANFNKVSVLLGAGNGTFGAPTHFAAGSSPIDVAVSDLNNDGKSDLAVVNTDSNNVSILLGNGSGSFGPATNFAAGTSFPLSVTVGDFNVDGKKDLAVGPNGGFPNTPGSVFIMTGDGTGSFKYPTAFTVGGGPSTLATGDFNNNGKIDLAVANASSNSVSVLLDSKPTVSINNVTVTEGDSDMVAANFTVTLSSVSDKDVQVTFSTISGGTATSSADFHATAGPLTIPAGSLTGTITVMVIGEKTFELDETFFVKLTTSTNAFIATEQGTGTILNDDPLPTLSINDVSSVEGHTGLSGVNFTVRLSIASSQPVTVNYVTSDGTALAGDDYEAQSGSVTFNPSQTTQLISILVKTDMINEPNETLFVTLSDPVNATITRAQGTGTILNDDDAPILFTVENSLRAIALDSVTWVGHPFSVTNSQNFAPDHRARIVLFAMNSNLMAGEDKSAITVQAHNERGFYNLEVEHVGPVPNFDWLTQITVLIPAEFEDIGDMGITVTLRGRRSNNVIVGFGHSNF
jgi:hypothetical protein